MFFIKPTLNGATFDITLKNYGSKKKQFNLYTDIIDKETGAILYSGLSIRKLRLNAGEERMETYTVNDLKPRLWTPQDRKSTRLNSSHRSQSRMPSSA